MTFVTTQSRVDRFSQKLRKGHGTDAEGRYTTLRSTRTYTSRTRWESSKQPTAGPGGQAVGVDMTAEMLDKARSVAGEIGADNVESREGFMETSPVESGSAGYGASDGPPHWQPRWGCPHQPRVPNWVPNFTVLAGLSRIDWTVTWTKPLVSDWTGFLGLKVPASWSAGFWVQVPSGVLASFGPTS